MVRVGGFVGSHLRRRLHRQILSEEKGEEHEEENNEEPFLPNVSSVGLFSDPNLSPHQPSRREAV